MIKPTTTSPIGCHVYKSTHQSPSGMADAIREAYDKIQSEINMPNPIFQIFVMSPHKPVPVIIEKESITALRRAMPNLRIIAHGSYVNNPWSLDSTRLSHLSREFQICADLGIEGLVIHLPKKPIAEVLDCTIEIIKQTKKPSSVRLILEQPALVPNENTYETPEKINRLCEGLSCLIKEGRIPDSIGICLDTAHLWSGGQSITTGISSERYLSRLDRPDMITLVHFNDNEKKLGVGGDIHANLMHGRIWDTYRASFEEWLGQYTTEPSGSNERMVKQMIDNTGIAAWIKWTQKNNIPIVLERNEELDFMHDIRVLKWAL